MGRVIVIGAGVVGTATGQGFTSHGHPVVMVDINQSRLNQLQEEGFTAIEPHELELRGDDIVFISVTALTDNDGIVLTNLRDACENLGTALRESSGFATIVVRCTIPPGTMRNVLVPVLEQSSGLTAGVDFGVVYNPEYLRAESARQDFLHPRVITLSSFTRGDRSHRQLLQLMESFEAPIVWLTFEGAEFQKYVNNVGNAIKISTYNWFRQYGSRCGVSNEEIDAAYNVSLQSAENLWNTQYGTRNFGAYGGECLPKDTRALLIHATQLGLDADLIKATEKVNNLMLNDRTDHVIDLQNQTVKRHA